jgi:hypothetical protein
MKSPMTISETQVSPHPQLRLGVVFRRLRKQPAIIADKIPPDENALLFPGCPLEQPAFHN